MQNKCAPPPQLFFFSLARTISQIDSDSSLGFFAHPTATATPESAIRYRDESGPLGHQRLHHIRGTLNSASLFRTAANFCNFFVSMFLSMRSSKPQLYLNLSSGFAIFLGSKKMEREQRCNFPSILHELGSTLRRWTMRRS